MSPPALCLGCRERLPPGSAFCPWCGQPAESDAPTRVVAEPAVARALAARHVNERRGATQPPLASPRRRQLRPRAWIVLAAAGAGLAGGMLAWWSLRGGGPRPSEGDAASLAEVERQAVAGDAEAASRAVQARRSDLASLSEGDAVRSLQALASLHARLGEPESAATWLEAAAAAGADRPAVARASLLSDAAAAHMLAGEEARAALLLDEAIRLSASHAAARANRGVLRLRRGDAGAALQDLERARAEDPTLGLAHAAAAHALLALGRLPEALAAAELALTAEPGSPVAAQAVAAAAAAAGHEVRAREFARRAEGLAPGRPEIEELLGR